MQKIKFYYMPTTQHNGTKTNKTPVEVFIFDMAWYWTHLQLL